MPVGGRCPPVNSRPGSFFRRSHFPIDASGAALAKVNSRRIEEEAEVDSDENELDEGVNTATRRRWLRKAARWLRQHVGVSVLLLSLIAAGVVFGFGTLAWDWLVSGTPEGESNGATLRNLGLLYAALVSGFLVAWRNSTAGREANAAQAQARAMELQVEAAMRHADAVLATARRQTDTAQRQVATAERGAALERIQAARALLSSGSLRDRLGAIEALRAVARESPEDHLDIVVRTLCSFARQPDGQTADSNESDPAAARDIHESAATREDVVAAVRAAASLPHDVADLEGRSRPRLELNAVLLRGASLGGIDLTGASLAAADLRDADLSRAILSQANLRHARLIDANLTRATAEDALLERALLTRANFTRAKLSGSDLIGSYLRSSNLSRADLRDVRLAEAELTDANLSRAQLKGASLTFAIADRANFTRSDLNGANLIRANLAQANFGRAHLVEADLTGSDLTRANFTNADLTRAQFSEADLSMARLVSANITGTWFAGDEWDATSDVDTLDRHLIVEGLTQRQLDRAVADPADWPHLETVVDAESGEPLEWRGDPLPDDTDEDQSEATS